MKMNCVKVGRMLLISTLVVVLFAFFPKVVLAIHSAEIRYVETNPVAGIWEYQYTVFNTSDEAGVDLNYVKLTFTGSTLSNFTLPAGWMTNFFYGSGDEFFQTFTPSLSSGEPSPPTDIAPGSFLSGFVLDFGSQVGDLPFDVGFLNPLPGESSLSYFGTTAASATPPIPEPGPTPVPEPASIILMITGMGVLGLVGKKGIKKA